jgi:hypothetical protein
MSYQGKKVVGIWMDQRHAFVISTESYKPHDGDFSVLDTIEKNDHSNDVYKNESAELKKDAADQKKYHAALMVAIKDVDAVYIFGPGKAQEEFKNVLKDNHQYKNKDIILGSSDKMSTKQMVERVKSIFDPAE